MPLASAHLPGYSYRGDTDPLSRLEGIELTQRLHGLRRGTKGAPVPCGVLNAGALRSLRPPPTPPPPPPPRPKTPPPPPPPPPFDEYTLRNLMRRTHMKNSDYFKMWDVDDSGYISRSEFIAGIRALGVTYATDEELHSTFDTFDLDGNNSIDYNELDKRLMAIPLHRPKPRRYRPPIVPPVKVDPYNSLYPPVAHGWGASGSTYLPWGVSWRRHAERDATVTWWHNPYERQAEVNRFPQPGGGGGATGGASALRGANAMSGLPQWQRQQASLQPPLVPLSSLPTMVSNNLGILQPSPSMPNMKVGDPSRQGKLW